MAPAAIMPSAEPPGQPLTSLTGTEAASLQQQPAEDCRQSFTERFLSPQPPQQITGGTIPRPNGRVAIRRVAKPPVRLAMSAAVQASAGAQTQRWQAGGLSSTIPCSLRTAGGTTCNGVSRTVTTGDASPQGDNALCMLAASGGACAPGLPQPPSGSRPTAAAANRGPLVQQASPSPPAQGPLLLPLFIEAPAPPRTQEAAAGTASHCTGWGEVAGQQLAARLNDAVLGLSLAQQPAAAPQRSAQDPAAASRQGASQPAVAEEAPMGTEQALAPAVPGQQGAVDSSAAAEPASPPSSEPASLREQVSAAHLALPPLVPGDPSPTRPTSAEEEAAAARDREELQRDALMGAILATAPEEEEELRRGKRVAGGDPLDVRTLLVSPSSEPHCHPFMSSK